MPETIPTTPHIAREAEPGATEYHAVEIGAGRPVVLLHDVYGSSDNWTSVMEELSDDWRCLALDLPGHGATTRIDRDADLDSLAEDLHQVMESFEAIPAAIVSHGASSLITLRMLAGRPDAATSAAFVSPGVVARGDEGVYSVEEDWFPVAYGESFFAEQPGRAAAERTRVGEMSMRAAGALHSLLASDRSAEVLRTAAPLGVPTLVIGSMRDHLVPPSQIDELARRLDADTEFMPDAGHMLPVERPEQVTALLRSFLERV